MHAARGVHKLEITSLVSEDLQPTIQLKTAGVVLKPIDSKISPLSSTRDVIPDGRQIYQNLLSYTLSVAKSTEVAIYAPIFNCVLYESEFESQLWMIFDANKHMVACGDAGSHKFFTKLDKGEYSIRLQIRHEKRDILEKINEATMIALFKLPNALTLDVFDQYNQSVICGRKFNNCTVKDYSPRVLYVPPLAQDKLAKASLPTNAAWLLGSITLAKDEVGRKTDCTEFNYILTSSDPAKKNGNNNGSTSTSNSLSFVAASKSKSAVSNNAAVALGGSSDSGGDAGVVGGQLSPKKSKSSVDDYAESLRDFQSSMLTKVGKYILKHSIVLNFCTFFGPRLNLCL